MARRAAGSTTRRSRGPRHGVPPPPGARDADRAGGAAAARREREALADIRDALARDDPDLTRSFGVLAGPRLGCWLAGLAGCAVLTGAAFAVLGVRAVGVVGLLLVLAAPVLVSLGCAGGTEPVEGSPPRP